MEGRSADYAFEVSSEGELEQVHSLIEWVLRRRGCVEVLFSSPSVEEKCLKLYQRHRGQVRIFRLPLLTFFPWGRCGGQNISHWLSAPVLILCRYDFYPELFLYGTQKGHRLYLVSASLKNKSRFLWAPLYRCFDKIVCSNDGERRHFLDWGWAEERLASYEFRSIRILSRLESKSRALSRWKSFVSWIETFSEKDRLIVGNAWPNEMEILQEFSLQKKIEKGKFLVLIAPHKTGAVFVRSLEEQMENLSAHILSHPDEGEYVLKKWKQSPGPIIFNVSGVLLEFYSLFRYALVGGGHGKGIHSLLEPFLAGCFIYCGPRVCRSSEYDFIRETFPERVKIVRDWKQLPRQRDVRKDVLLGKYQDRFEKVARWLLEDKEC